MLLFLLVDCMCLIAGRFCWVGIGLLKLFLFVVVSLLDFAGFLVVV